MKIATAIIAASLALATPAVAQDMDREGYCQDLAGMTYAMAKYRDRGYTLENALWVLQENYDETVSEDELHDALVVVDYLYKFPHNTPTYEANVIYSNCIEVR